jgi:bleomycin hydrolase
MPKKINVKAKSKSKSTAGKNVKLKLKLVDQVTHLTLSIKKSEEMMDEVRKQMTESLQKEHQMAVCPTGIPLNTHAIDAYSVNYKKDKSNIFRTNALASLPMSACAENRAFLHTVNYSYSHSLQRVPRATSQENSGRCWLFAALNSMRYYLMRDLNLPDNFELSEAYLFFYDKLERANLYLENMVLYRHADQHDFKLQCLIKRPVDDGGVWSFVVNLIKKYGIVPKTIYGESFNSSISSEMNQALTDKLAQFALEIREDASKTDAYLRNKIVTEMIPVIYQLLSNFMGEPPKTDDVFDWEYNEAGENVENVRHKGSYKLVKALTPLTFYHNFIVEHYDVTNMVLLRNDPRATSSYNTVYTTELMGNMVGGQPELAFNLCMEHIKNITSNTIIAGHPVWFACEVQRDFNAYYGLLAVEGYDYDSLLGMCMAQTKEESLISRNGGPTHAMAIVGLNLKEDAEFPDKWKIENSWGEFNEGDPGYLLMTDAWFDRYGYEVVVPISMLPEQLADIYNEQKYNPTVLPFNDAFGVVS